MLNVIKLKYINIFDEIELKYSSFAKKCLYFNKRRYSFYLNLELDNLITKGINLYKYQVKIKNTFLLY